MKRFFSMVFGICLILTLVGCEHIDFNSVVSELYNKVQNELYEAEEIVEIKYEEYEIREPQFNACFAVLGSKQKNIYKLIYAISEEMPEGFVRLCDDYDNAVNDIAIAYNAFLNDNAGTFWMPKSYILGTSERNGVNKIAIAFDYESSKKKNSYTVNPEQRETMQKQLDEFCKKVTDKLSGMSSEYEKEKYINDIICDTVTYVDEGDFAHTAYGALIEGKALCEGYSRAFKLLCNKADIECDLIVGEAEGVGHMWNRVNIDKKLSFVDVTWNDRSDFRTYTYFNITEQQLLSDHTIAPLFTKLNGKDMRSILFNFTEKNCSYSGNTFYEKNNRVLWNDYNYSAARTIEDVYNKGERYAEFMFATENIQSVFKENPEEFIVKIQKQLSNVFINGYSNERDTLILFFE